MKAILVFALVLLSCSSKEKVVQEKTSVPPETQVNAPPAVPFTTLGLAALTNAGENLVPRFSPDGSRIIFQSRNRPGHKSAQIYILNLQTKRERRITYNDGDDFAPSFGPNGKHIIYSSTTDEIKEHPDGGSMTNAPFSPDEIKEQKDGFQEVYLSEADGSHIVRLTRNAGFDGQGDFSPDGSRILFVSSRSGQSSLFVTDMKGKSARALYSAKDYLASPRFSPKGSEIVFESRASGPSTLGPVQIQTIEAWGKTPKVLTTHDGVNRDPSWTPDGKQIIFSSNRENKNAYFIYVMNTDGTCLKRISPDPELKSKTDLVADLYPSVSSDGKKLLFASNRGGTFQIYVVDFTSPKDCSPDRP